MVEGINADGVTQWLRAHVPVLESPVKFTLITGGHSNLTYRCEDAASQRVRVASSAARTRARECTRHGARAQDHRGVGENRSAGCTDVWAVQRCCGQRRAVLRHEVHRRAGAERFNSDQGHPGARSPRARPSRDRRAREVAPARSRCGRAGRSRAQGSVSLAPVESLDETVGSVENATRFRRWKKRDVCSKSGCPRRSAAASFTATIGSAT